MKLFEKDETKPGNVILQAGLLSYFFAALAGMASMNAGIEAAAPPMTSLILVPIYSALVMALLGPPLALLTFVGGAFSGVPFSYFYSVIRRNWRAIAGALLLLSVLVAAASTINGASLV